MADPERLLRARRLLRVFDVRPVDPLTGTRPTAAEYKAFADAPRCHRCGQEHVKVYEVECDDGRPYTVGSGCVARTFGGWEPGKEDLVRVRKAETKARRIAEEEARKAWVQEAARRVLAACPRLPGVPEVRATLEVPAMMRGTHERLDIGTASFRYVPTQAAIDQLRAEPDPVLRLDKAQRWAWERAEGFKHMAQMWPYDYAEQCLAQTAPPPSPQGHQFASWNDAALQKLGLQMEVASAVREAWGRRR